MSDAARTAEEAIERLERHDTTLRLINLSIKQHTDAEAAALVECLHAHPDVVKVVFLAVNRLTDETGVELARYVAASSTIEKLGLSDNQVGSSTHLALASALRVNTSLQYLFLHRNRAEDKSCIDAAFVETLQLNSRRPVYSAWYLYTGSNDFSRLQSLTKQLGPPSMLSQHNACETWHETNKFRTL